MEIVIACQTCGYLIKDIANAYINDNIDVTLLTSRNCYDNIRGGLFTNVKFKSVVEYNRSSSFGRISTWMIGAIQMFFIILFSHRKSKVLYVSNPPIGPLLPLALKNRFSLLIWDIYPDVLVNQNFISKNSIIAKWWSKSNRKVYKRAEHVFTISNGMKKCLAAYVDENRIKVIPLWPDNSNLQRIEKKNNLFLKNNCLDGKFIVMYSGNMGETHRIEVIVDVAKCVDDEDIIFVIIGDGVKKKQIEQRIIDESVKNVLLLPYQPYDFLSHSLSAADIAIVTLDSSSSQMSVPSKTFNLMRLGKPLLCIASPESELGCIVKEHNVGDIFNPEDIKEIADFIINIKNNKELLSSYSENSITTSLNFTCSNAKMFI